MKFAVITHVIHKKDNKQYFAYGPYVKEMNIWLKNVDQVCIVAPLSKDKINTIDLAYSKEVIFNEAPAFSLTSVTNVIMTMLKLPIISYKIFKAMYWAEHIHLRLPGNMGLLGSIIQIFFPKKPKTVKYAGNWDPNSKQPWSYNLQKWIVSNTFLSRNIKVLVYGKWPNQTKNIIPFFTATYSKKDIFEVSDRKLTEPLKFIFVGSLVNGKQPILALKIIKKLKNSGLKVNLDVYGDGVLKPEMENYIKINHLNKNILLHGNKSAETVKKAYQQACFLLFLSKSEGWPKVVAEAMLWKCLPITTEVSAVPYMLDYGKRGSLVKPDIEEIVEEIKFYINNPLVYKKKLNNAYNWSKRFTLDKFEDEIKKFL